MTSATAPLPATPPDRLPTDAPAWATEAFLLCADDRAGLRDAALALAAWLDANPDVRLADLAYTLIHELRLGGSRLAVVAGSAAELQARLTRAAARLADDGVRQVRDTQGVYFFERPLYTPGAVAVLAPGEGAQSLGMIGELCTHFPEVAYGFRWCDQVAEEAGRPEASLRPLIFPPADATAEQRALDEAKLRELGPSIFSVLVADLAVHELLKNLRLPVTAYAGHSAGELAALYAAGAIPQGSDSSAGLVATMDMMQRQEEASGGETLVLATGAGQAAIAEVVAARGLADVYVAMDNCPHQSVVVGEAAGVRTVEAALQERGVLCERLPFRRPYHTRLFTPWMGPFYELFDRIPIRAPHTPVYSATTAARFPNDPDAIRKLTVDHWKSPVEFTRMIEAMYADGVRLFVESGPRGNLSAFVEDILRGRPFAALPIDTTRRNGVTQLNHVVAQLLAHHVPINAEHLFAYREARPLEWRGSEQRPATVGPPPRFEEVPAEVLGFDRSGILARSMNEAGAGPDVAPPSSASEGNWLAESPQAFEATDSPITPVTPAPDSPSDREVVVMRYLGVMEQFLDAQRDVMGAWLGGDIPADAAAALFDGAFPSLDDLFAAPAPGLAPDSEAPPPALEVVPGTLIAEVVRLEPGREVVVQRRLDLAEDLYVADHTIGGRNASQVDPHQHGLPVLPMTFSLELMGECVELLLPGWVVTAFRDIRLMRWLPFEAEPTTVEVTATVQPTAPPTVRAVIRDVGVDKVTAQGVVEVARAYPEAPAAGAFQQTGERACKASRDDVYRNLFHGPLFQGIRSLDRYGDEGIEGTVEVLPRDQWFRSTREPRFVTDPVLVDACMHVLGAWHLEQPDWNGRILLPIGLKRIEFFGPPPVPGTVLGVRGINEEASARHFVHGVEVYHPDGRLWCRLSGAAYWRFYLPFGHVNFFGPKDEYFLSRPLPEALPASTEPARCWFLEVPTDLLTQPVLRAAGARVTMTARELQAFARLSKELPDDEVNAWLFGRIVGKDAVRSLRTERYGDRMFPADIEFDWDGRSRPVAAPRDPAHPGAMPNVAVAVHSGRVAAVSAFRPRLGIAVAPVGDSEEAARCEAARGALASALPEADLRLPTDAFRLVATDLGPAAVDCLVSLPREAASAYPDLGAGPLVVRTYRLDDVLVATTFCETVTA